MQGKGLKNLVTNRRLMAVLLLYISSGLPLALTGSTLQAWYTVAGVNLLAIGALTLVGQPYTYKVLWAPLLDRFMPINLGRRRSWIFIMQLCLAIGLVVMAFLHPKTEPGLLATVALIVAFFSATQDTAIDAYRTDLLSVNERGLGASMVAIGYRLAVLMSGALALILAAEIGWRATYLIMAGIMIVEMFITLWVPRVQHELNAPRTLTKAVIEPLREFLSRKNAILILVFIIIYKLSDAFALSLNTTFLLKLGFSLIDVGSISKIVGVVAILLGSLMGGLLIPRLGLYRALLYFGFLQIASNLLFALLAIVGKSFAIMGSSIFIEYFCGGLSTTAFVVFLTSLCNKRYTATQYALFSALTSIGRVFVGPEAALMVQHIGWVQFYLWTFIFGIPSLMLLMWLKNRVDFNAEILITVKEV